MSTFVSNDVASGAVIKASDHNEMGSRIAAVVNGGLEDANISSGAAISGSKIADGTLDSSSLADAAVTPAKLLAGTGTSWPWQTWTPTFTNLTGGTLNYAKCNQTGKTVYYRFKYTLAGTGISGSVTFTLPATANSDYTTDNDVGQAHYIDNGAQLYTGYAAPSSTTIATLKLHTVSGSNVIGTANLSSTAPFTWNTGDYLIVSGSYEAA